LSSGGLEVRVVIVGPEKKALETVAESPWRRSHVTPPSMYGLNNLLAVNLYFSSRGNSHILLVVVVCE